jgi:hypothetical protein
MLMINRLFIFLALAFFSATSHADGTTGAGLVRMLHFYNGHTGLLIAHANLIDPDACGSGSYIILSDTYPHYKDVYAMLLAAKISGQPVTIYVSGCLQGYPQLRHISLAS